MAIREIITILVVLFSSVAGLANPRIGMYGYVWFALFRPDALSWSMGRYPYSITMAVAILIGNIRNLQQIVPTIFLNPFSRLFLLILFSFTLSTIESVDGIAAGNAYIAFMKSSIMTLMLPMLFNELAHVRNLFLLVAVSFGFIGMYFGILGTLMGGIRIISGIGGSLADNNFVGLAMTMVLPFCWYGISMTTFKPLKVVLALMAFGSVATVIFAQSRGSFVGLVVVMLALTLQSRHKFRVLVITAILLVPAAYLTWWQFSSRIATLKDPTQESSANSRILSMQFAIDVWRDYPVFGVGPGDDTLVRVAGAYDLRGLRETQAIHSAPFQVLAHLGAVGLVAWCLYYGYAVIYCFRSAGRMKRRFPGLEIYPRAVLASLLGYLTATIAYPRAWFEIGYMFPMFAGCWYLVERSLLSTSTANAADTIPATLSPVRPSPPASYPAAEPPRLPAWERPRR